MTLKNTEKVIKAWLEGAKKKDGQALLALLSENVVLLPPFQEHEVNGAMNVLVTFAAVESVIQEFGYGRSWAAENTAILEFKATIDGKPIHGVDVIHLDAEGKIDRFDIMVRPAGTAQIFGAAVLKHLAANASIQI